MLRRSDYIIAVVVFLVNILFVPALLYAVGIGYLPWGNALVAFALWAWVTLPGTTWRDYAAGTNVIRVRKGGSVVLPPPEQCCLTPDHERLLAWQLDLPAFARNFLFNATWGAIYFLEWPRWEVGFTRRMNRYREGLHGAVKQSEAFDICARWLDRMDARGKHT